MPLLNPQQLQQRFTLVKEIRLLYDRRTGLEHHLNATAVEFVEATFGETDPIASLSDRFRVSTEVIERDLREFWSGRFAAAETVHPERKTGAPKEWAKADVAFPLALEVELTRACNWHCDFCYNVWKVPDDFGKRGRSDSAAERQVHMPLPLVREVISQAADGGCLRMRFSGGEPSMHPQLREIIAEATEAGLDTELFTNGTRMTPDEARRLAGLGLRVVLISVHGDDRTHNALASNPAAANHAWRGVRASVGAGMTTMAEALVCEDNLEEMPRLVERLYEEGVKHVSFMPYVPYGPKDPRRPVLLTAIAEMIDSCQESTGGGSTLRVPCAPRHCLSEEPVSISEPVRREFDDHCAAGLLWASVSYDGQFRHCPHSSVFAGRVSSGMAGLWREVMRPTVRAALQPEGACTDCSQLAACGGGCHLDKVTSYPATGTGASRRLLPIVATTSGGRSHA